MHLNTIDPVSLYLSLPFSLSQVGKVHSAICLDASKDAKYSYKMWMDKVESEVPVPAHNSDGGDIATIIYTSGKKKSYVPESCTDLLIFILLLCVDLFGFLLFTPRNTDMIVRV